MYKFALLFIFILFPLSSAIQLSISPSEIFLNASTDSFVCKKIKIFCQDCNDSFSISTKWQKNPKNTRELSDYSEESHVMHISVISESKIYAKEKRETEICFSAKNAGIYHGAVLLKPENSNIGIGSWIILDVKREYPRILSITGNIIGSSQNNSILTIMFILISLLLFILLVLLRKKLRK